MSAKTEMVQTQAPKLDARIVESIVLHGDIGGLNAPQKVAYANALAVSVGLDPATTPFKSIKMQGREVMYADKGTAEQLRKLHCVDIKIVDKREEDGIFYVTARASLPNGRGDEDVGAVPLDVCRTKADRANAVMKAHTKAKRRVTLSILGLGMLDESEFDTIPQARFDNIPKEEPVKANVVTIEPKREPAKKEATEAPVPETVESIPESIANKIKPLHGLANIPLVDMDDDDLELVIDQAGKWAAMPGVGKRVALWLQALGNTASKVFEERNGPGGPALRDDAEAP